MADASSVQAAYGPAIDGDDPTEVLIAELDGRAIGMLQRYLLSDNPDYAQALAPAGGPGAAAEPRLPDRGGGPDRTPGPVDR